MPMPEVHVGGGDVSWAGYVFVGYGEPILSGKSDQAVKKLDSY